MLLCILYYYVYWWGMRLCLSTVTKYKVSGSISRLGSMYEHYEQFCR